MNIKITIFTDGASKGNPGPGGWGAVVADNERVVELGGHEENTTNNRMEMMAIYEALSHVVRNYSDTQNLSIHVLSDSTYSVKGITQWVDGWISRGWVTASKDPVQNRDLWEKMHDVVQGLSIKWTILPGHSGIPGNERADDIASTYGDGNNPDLFVGARSEYGVDIASTQVDEALLKAKKEKKKRSGAKAYSYLSLIDGVLRRHDNWAECQARVEGKSGARFKKSLDAQEEKEIIESWGKTIDDIQS